MKTKYDEYMERELPYRMTLEELFEKSDNGRFYTEVDVLAYIRERGEKFTCLCPASTPSDMCGVSPLGMMVSGRSEKVPCRIYIDKNKDSYNPLFEDTIAGGVTHFSSTYKISMTPIEFEGCVETFYFSDFVSMINDGRIILQEIEF